eukprot:XP_025013338.1 nascent polypeptide-associated complex subunit alpha, muscle-specific form [Ricinus communis]
MAHPQSRTGAISQFDGINRQGEAPRTPTSPTIEQLLRGNKHNSVTKAYMINAYATYHLLWSIRYKETARQHPRAIPVISEKHVMTSSVNTAKSVRTTHSPRSASRTTAPITPKAASKTISETVAEKLAPAYATVTEATYAIASKIQSLAISGPEPQAPTPAPTAPNSPAKKTSLSPKSPGKSSLATQPHEKPTIAPILAGKSCDPPTPSPRARALTPQAPAPVATKQEVTRTTLEKAEPVSAPAAVTTTTNHASASEQIWDKGVSVKEYIMHKLEPGEDEKALSQVISQAISPRKGPGDTGVVEKVREAVTFLLRNNETSQAQQQRLVFHSAQNSSSNIPISTNAHEAAEGETHGRILQAN